MKQAEKNVQQLEEKFLNNNELTKELGQLKSQLQQKLDSAQSQLKSRDSEMGELKKKLEGTEKSLAELGMKCESQVDIILTTLFKR